MQPASPRRHGPAAPSGAGGAGADGAPHRRRSTMHKRTELKSDGRTITFYAWTFETGR